MDTQTSTIKIKDDKGTIVSAKQILELCAPKRIIAFDAPMGTGKTTLIKQLCQELGTTDIVNSPTFALVNVYELENGKEVYHFDCYRLKDLKEAVDLGAEEYLYSGNYCFIEWPEILEPLLPDDTLFIHMRVKDNNDRTLTFDIAE